MTETIQSLNASIEALTNEVMEIKSTIAKTDSIMDIKALTYELSNIISLLEEDYRKVTELERKEYNKKEIIEYWTSRWDYIGMFDALIEVNKSAYKGLLTISELKAAYKEIEEYNY